MQADPVDESSSFIWQSSGNPVNDFLWCPGEPSDGGGNEDHVHLAVKRTTGGLKFPCLNDVHGESYTMFCICKQ